jgi:hypothetical protein
MKSFNDRFRVPGVPRWIMEIALLAIVLQGYAGAQVLPPEVEDMGYADTVFLNGKVVSMEDASSSTEVGRVYQAIAVKRDKIMKLGTTEDVRTMAGRKRQTASSGTPSARASRR